MFIQPQKDNGFTCQTWFQYHQGNKKLFKARLYLPKKTCLNGKLIALKDAVIPFRLYTHWDQSFPILQDVKSEISHWFKVLNQWNGKEISLFPSYEYVLTTRIMYRFHSQKRKQSNQNLTIPVVNNSIEHVVNSSINACAVNGTCLFHVLKMWSIYVGN
ncbi:hypothetical protein ACTFIR_012810 [Dictyostelium discoideum]